MIQHTDTTSQLHRSGRLQELSRIAKDVGAEKVATDAQSLATRVAEGLFYVVCIGQFKRGKSTLLNALVGAPILPTGVVPVTAVVTVLRYGERLDARLRLATGESRECDPHSIASYVSEDENPGNRKSVSAVEVFVPSGLLETGMCLVDTPGIGSVFAANTATTRAFVPHIDASLVVLGADPPISGEELTLIEEVARQTSEFIFVLSKADRLSDADREQATRFAERVLSDRLDVPLGFLYQISATERLDGSGPSRDWNSLVSRLETLAHESGADLICGAEERGVAFLIERLLGELQEQ